MNNQSTTTLFEFPSANGEDTAYGNKLAVNSAGAWIMDERGTGATIVVPKDKLDSVKEVMPHTIGIAFGTTGTTYHYFADADKYAVGDTFLLSNKNNGGAFSIVTVLAVDTKSRMASVDFNPARKILTEDV